MKKQSRIIAISFAALAVLYAAATATASPFIARIHEFVASNWERKAPTPTVVRPDIELTAEIPGALEPGLASVSFISDLASPASHQTFSTAIATSSAGRNQLHDDNLSENGLVNPHNGSQFSRANAIGALALADPDQWTFYPGNDFPNGADALPKLLDAFPIVPDPRPPDTIAQVDETPTSEKITVADHADDKVVPGPDEMKDTNQGDTPTQPGESEAVASTLPGSTQDTVCDGNVNASGANCFDLITSNDATIIPVMAIHAMPEPGSLVLLGLGLAGLRLSQRRRA